MHKRISQIIIFIFLIVLVIIAYFLNMDIKRFFNESISKFLMNGLLVISLIPMINAGIGINFGLPVGIVSGLIGMCISINMKFTGAWGFIVALFFTTIIGWILGEVYGRILNYSKGREEITGTFIGFSFVFLMNFFWTLIPFKNRGMLYPIGGKGLRPKISLNNYFDNILDNFLLENIGGYKIPIGSILFYTLICVFIYLFFKTSKGKTMLAVGENEKFCKGAGIDIKGVKIEAVIISTIIAGYGICVYSQSYGFVELYNAPMMMAFPAASAILIGGANSKRVYILEAIIGTYLFHTIYLLSSPIANEILLPEVSEIFRMIVSNSIILYALLKTRRVKNES